jgi:hypothetical protein
MATTRQITDLLQEKKPWTSMPPPRLEIFTGDKLAEPAPPMQKILKSQVTRYSQAQRRKMVLELMYQYPDSYTIAKKLGLPRGTVWHDILYLRKHIPELKNFARKPSNRLEVQ